MVAPNPDRFRPLGPPARLELRERVREIVGSVASSVRRAPVERRGPLVQVVVAAGKPFRVTVEVLECDAAFGGVVPVVTIQAVRARRTLSRWLRDHFGLTGREARVAFLLARRQPNAEIARALRISPHTVRRHTEKVMLKLNVRSRFEVRDAIVAARRRLRTPERDRSRARRGRSSGAMPVSP